MNSGKKYHIGILATHPVQYYCPWYRALAKHPEVNLEVFYCRRQTPRGQAEAGFGIEFEWDIPLLDGYKYQFLNNKSPHPNVYTFFGCDTAEIKRIIYKNAFDAFIVHGWYVKSFWQAIIACWRTHTPILVRGDSQLLLQRSLIKRWLKYPFYRWFIPRFDGYLVVGKRAKEYYIHYGADEKKMFFTPHSVDNAFFGSSRARLEQDGENLRKKWGIPNNAVVFLFAGKLIPKKRPFDFLKALAIARKYCDGLFGLIAGDGPLRFKLEVFSQTKKLPVAFAGFLNQKEIPEAYRVSDVLVLPSDSRETWGLVVNEAMASGVPAIVSDKAGCAPDLIRPAETGEVFSCGDIRRLSEILIEFASNPGHLKKMGQKAKELIEGYSVNNSLNGAMAAIKPKPGICNRILAKCL